ncbi:MAG: hypothetical protein BroJett030_07170 [Alphaproteobacteria bacterium]|nr:MAG: hypothetical protein BroJett030_07170 [Alphaproteobacteria bacterium]
MKNITSIVARSDCAPCGMAIAEHPKPDRHRIAAAPAGTSGKSRVKRRWRAVARRATQPISTA